VLADVRLRRGRDQDADHHVEQDREPDPERLEQHHERQPRQVGRRLVERLLALERARVRVQVLEEEQAHGHHSRERVQPLEREVLAVGELHRPRSVRG
jgi:hypothetical protein